MGYITRTHTAPLSLFFPCTLAVLGATPLASAQDAPSDEPPAAQPLQTAQAEVEVDADARVDVAAPPPPAAAPPPPPPAPEPAGDEFPLEVHWGVGIRTELELDPDDAAADGATYQARHNVRPYVMGQVTDFLKFEGNLDSEGNNIRVLDGVLKFEFNDFVNLWVGHFLPPSDRANLSGPYFQNAWNYPAGQHIYPSQYAGRDDGFAYWGQYNGGQVKWQLGFFNLGTPNPDPRFSGRVVVNLLDPEPGYYNSSTYYGSKDVLAIGAVVHHTPSAVNGQDGDTIWNLDMLYENSFPGTGTLNVEGAFYGFGGADAGTSFSALASFLLADKMGPGQLQPMARFQRASWEAGDTIPATFALGAGPVGDDTSQTTIDVGLHYILNGHNARLAATFSHVTRSVDDFDASNTLFTLGGQIQVF
jgi:hypothetical protein